MCTSLFYIPEIYTNMSDHSIFFQQYHFPAPAEYKE